MRQPIICGLVMLTLLVQARRSDAQTSGAPSTGPYSLTISVDEVSLTFHAADARTVSLSTT